MTSTYTTAPGARTTELLEPVPDGVRDALAQAGAPFDLASAVPEPQDAPPLRWGILGAGTIASTFLWNVQAYSSGRVAVVGSRDAERARELIEQHTPDGIAPARAVGSYEELVADPDIDAVYVATPHSHHAEHARLALEAGKHVLVEKAFTRSAAEARGVLETARRRGLFAMEAMWSRFLPSQVLTRAVVDSGALGEVRFARADHYQRNFDVPRMARPELAGGALLDLGVYPVSFLHSILGVPQAVHAVGRLTEAGVDLDEVVTLAHGRGTGVASSGMDARSGVGAEVVGTAGRLELEPAFYQPTVLRLTLTDEDGAEAMGATWDGRVPGGFQFQAAEVARCVAEGRTESPVMPWQATVEVMEILDEVRAQIGVRYPGE